MKRDLSFFGSALIASDNDLSELRVIFDDYWKDRAGYSYDEWVSQAGSLPEVGPWEAFVIGWDRGESK